MDIHHNKAAGYSTILYLSNRKKTLPIVAQDTTRSSIFILKMHSLNSLQILFAGGAIETMRVSVRD